MVRRPPATRRSQIGNKNDDRTLFGPASGALRGPLCMDKIYAMRRLPLSPCLPLSPSALCPLSLQSGVAHLSVEVFPTETEVAAALVHEVEKRATAAIAGGGGAVASHGN